MTIQEAGKGIVINGSELQTYGIGFNDGDQTELLAYTIMELNELWNSLCSEFGCSPESIDYVERL